MTPDSDDKESPLPPLQDSPTKRGARNTRRRLDSSDTQRSRGVGRRDPLWGVRVIPKCVCMYVRARESLLLMAGAGGREGCCRGGETPAPKAEPQSPLHV